MSLIDGVGCESQDENGRIRRIHLSIRRIVRQIRRELASSRIDRRLHVPRGRVDVAAEVELQYDVRRAEITG